ncbi:class I SAM-dependent methyltransferase [Rhizobium sp. EC-SD404]|uniref:class I SAM-dependent methyltransferase n=1 Tax=Rhizobium sp. EC-SD404 TaxID=2038389 RepID=UPI001256D76A|nr:class I SAM-dependent methyltransferase [Rhizobium sp. EC-SD404]VVT31998.1 conserved hypothetical protein [Rhizobium sp. EC-SD404]
MGEPETFELGGQRFRIDTRAGKDRSLSNGDSFTLVKTKAMIDFYQDLAKSIEAKHIFEVGVFQGGSYVLLDQIFSPTKMTAVDLSDVPVDPLMDYISSNSSRSVHWGKSQSDEAALQKIVDQDLGGRLDLVVDDASHLYSQTRRTFEILFPRLQPGGTYIIEDWAWSHRPAHQKETSPWAGQPALTNLVFEIIVLLASGPLIDAVSVRDHAVIITKSKTQRAVRHFKSRELWEDLKLRGREMPRI